MHEYRPATRRNPVNRRRDLPRQPMWRISAVVGRLGYVDGHSGRAPDPRTAGGAFVVGAGHVAMFLPIVALSVWTPWRRRRDSPQDKPLSLAGFTDEATYLARTPAWEVDDLPGMSAAQAEARRWLDQRPADACVEIIEFRGRTGHVIMVVTQTGSEAIG